MCKRYRRYEKYVSVGGRGIRVGRGMMGLGVLQGGQRYQVGGSGWRSGEQGGGGERCVGTGEGREV